MPHIQLNKLNPSHSACTNVHLGVYIQFLHWWCTSDNDALSDNDQACSGNMAMVMSKQSSSSINVQLVTLPWSCGPASNFSSSIDDAVKAPYWNECGTVLTMVQQDISLPPLWPSQSTLRATWKLHTAASDNITKQQVNNRSCTRKLLIAHLKSAIVSWIYCGHWA